MADNQPTSPLFRTKPMERILEEAKEHKGGLKRVLNAFDLTAIGVGAVIGAGIFVLTGTAAAEHAGPGVILSYLFAGLTCIIAAMCYAEFASRLPISGSAYSYSYASVGELFAWIIGWDLVLEYTIGASTVAVGWTKYLAAFLDAFGLSLPEWLHHTEFTNGLGVFHANWLAGIVILLLTGLLAIGIKESARFNAAMVLLKVAVVLFVIFAGVGHFNAANWDPFLPFGWEGVVGGAAVVFFAYIGFDAVSTAAEEVVEPEKNLPIGIIASLLICTLLYMAVAAVITGMVPYAQIDLGAPLAVAFGDVGMPLAQNIIGVGGVIGLTTVMLILLMSQPRIYYSMARDGLLMPWFAKVHEKFRTPINATILTGIIAAGIAMFAPMKDLHHMVSIGTLFAFTMVCAGVLITRYKSEDNPTESTKAVTLFGAGLILAGLMTAFDFARLSEQIQHGWIAQNIGIPESFAPTWDMIRLVIGGLGGLFALYGGFKLFGWWNEARTGKRADNKPSTFKAPLVPILPMIGMAANIYLMTNLDLVAWERLFIWLAFGLVIYAFYGQSHSKLAE